MKKSILLIVSIVALSFAQAAPVITDVIQGGLCYTVHKSDSSSLGTMRTSMYYVKDTGWTNTAKWSDCKGFLNAFFDSAAIWFNPRWCQDTNYYIPQFLYKGQSAGWLHRRIDWTRTNVDSFVEIIRQN
jgi:hypothetical protein